MWTSEIGLVAADPFWAAELDYRYGRAHARDRRPVRRRHRRLRLPRGRWLALPGQPGRPVALG